MKLASIIFLSLVLIGCAKSGYKEFYNPNPYVDAQTSSNLELLGSNEEPKVYVTDNFERDIQILNAKRYVVIGQSAFNGGYEDKQNVLAQAKSVGATLVLISSEYTNTETSTKALFIPNNQTTYHSGSINSGGSYGSYSGTSTTYGSSAVPYTTHQRRYDQTAVFLVKHTYKMKFGVQIDDLTLEQRSELERNTGAVIQIVFEDTPAFYANVMAGDFLIAVDGALVKNMQHGLKLMGSIPEGQLSSVLTVLRKGKEKPITVEF